jgi:hypothetical protein
MNIVKIPDGERKPAAAKKAKTTPRQLSRIRRYGTMLP